jgi:cytochrome c553
MARSATGRSPLFEGLIVLAVLGVGAVIGGAVIEYSVRTRVSVAANLATVKPVPTGDMAADVARLKTLVPSQSHTMADVGYHWSGLWFAGQQGNWPLAQFYFDETRQHIKWTINIRPVRKDPDGNDVNLKGIFDAVDSGAFADVKRTIEQQDHAAFATAYKASLEACYACHKSSGKPYLRPMIPRTPPQTLINYDPKATWPQ